MAGKLDKRVAIITGGGSGIGRGTAIAFAREGALVSVADISVQKGEQTVRLIKENGHDAVFIQCDVSKAADVKAMVNKTVEVYGRLDCAFNNAGIPGETMPIVDYPEEVWHQLIGVNLTGVWLCMKYEIAEMLKQGKGAIVNTASVQGLIGGPGFSAYTASKHGVVGLTKTVALEYAKAGIRANAVCPGVIETPIHEAVLAKHPEMEEPLINMHPVGRIGKVEEVSEAVVWLCSDSASFVVGHAMAIDGGLVAQ